MFEVSQDLMDEQVGRQEVSKKESLMSKKGVDVCKLLHINKDTTGKAPWHLVDLKALEGIAFVRAYGNKKYAPDSWKYVENAVVKYKDALMRHLVCLYNGEVLDPESGLPHIDHILTNAMFLSYFQRTNTGGCKDEGGGTQG